MIVEQHLQYRRGAPCAKVLVALVRQNALPWECSFLTKQELL
jgi:hypothetical protein